MLMEAKREITDKEEATNAKKSGTEAPPFFNIQQKSR
jgi:hypothetical protein